MEGIEKVYYYLNDAGTYYLATVDGDKPKVRPFGTILLDDGRLYIQTGRVKDVSKQIAANPKFEICAFMNGTWLRVAGELVDDDNHEAKVAAAHLSFAIDDDVGAELFDDAIHQFIADLLVSHFAATENNHDLDAIAVLE